MRAAMEIRVARATTKIKDRSRKRAARDGPAIDDDVHGALTRALFEGRLAPGSKLPEHRLATIFGVSRERVRKVLHRLVAERRLERIPRRGTFVPNPSPEEIRTVYGADRAASVRLSGEFHVLLVDSLKSPELSHFLRELLARSSLMVSAFEPARLSLCSVDEHAAIAEALKARNVERAIALSNEHFTHIEDRLAQGIVERVERRIEDALEPLVPVARGSSRKGRNRRPDPKARN